jgi:cytochrome P450
MEFPLGAALTLEQLDRDPHPALARLRAHEPVSWIAALDGWLVTSYELVVQAMRDSATFTVDDPRFSTAQVIGRSMLSLDGAEHEHHRAPFVAPFRPGAVSSRFADSTAAEAHRLIDGFASDGAIELRRQFAGPLAASIIARALGFGASEVSTVLSWYDAIVAAVTAITAGEPPPAAGVAAALALRSRLLEVIESPDGESGLAPAARGSVGGSELAAATGGPELAAATGGSVLPGVGDAPGLSPDELTSNAAVLLFGGIETTEGMIANALLAILARSGLRDLVTRDPRLLDSVLEESLRLEPAAAVIDRYATADVTLGGAAIRAGELVRLSIAGANRDPNVFPDPDSLDLARSNARRHLAFAHGPHVCLGVHLARLEARTAIAAVLARLPSIRLDADRPPQVRGLVFRKPDALHVTTAR